MKMVLITLSNVVYLLPLMGSSQGRKMDRLLYAFAVTSTSIHSNDHNPLFKLLKVNGHTMSKLVGMKCNSYFSMLGTN